METSECEIPSPGDQESYEDLRDAMQSQTYWIRFFMRPCCPPPGEDTARARRASERRDRREIRYVRGAARRFEVDHRRQAGVVSFAVGQAYGVENENSARAFPRRRVLAILPERMRGVRRSKLRAAGVDRPA